LVPRVVVRFHGREPIISDEHHRVANAIAGIHPTDVESETVFAFSHGSTPCLAVQLAELRCLHLNSRICSGDFNDINPSASTTHP
jgi:hypothetical protein